MHVTLRAGLSSLRSQLLYPTVRIAISRATRHAPDRFRIIHFSVQSNHVHLIAAMPPHGTALLRSPIS